LRNFLAPTDTEDLTAGLGSDVNAQIRQFANGFLGTGVLQDALDATGRRLILGPVTGKNILAAVSQTDSIMQLWFVSIWEKRRADAVNVKTRKRL
jgi:hypothetical protein